MNNCPCCSHLMLRQVRQHQLYWFCRNCWQEMPIMETTPSLLTVSALSNRVRTAQYSPVLVSMA